MLEIFLVNHIMLPLKLKALNDSSTDESSGNDDVPVKITKEALVSALLFIIKTIFYFIRWVFSFNIIRRNINNVVFFVVLCETI